MSLTLRHVSLLLSLVLFIHRAEFAPTFSVTPVTPFVALEGSEITLVWQYNFDASFGEAVLRFLYGTPVQTLVIVDKFSLSANTSIGEAYRGRVRENITATYSVITLLNVSRLDKGSYQLEIVTSPPNRQRASATTEVKVNYPPEFTNVSDDVVLVEGEGDSRVTLECIAVGEPTPNIIWTRVYANGSDSGVLATANQLVRENNRTESGTYRCTAYNGIGTAPNRTVKVEVNFKPEIIKPLVNDSTVCEGDVISITCSAVSRPAVHTYELFENGILVIDGNSSAGVEILRRDVKEGNFSYRCVSNNTIGTTEETVNITVRVPSKVYPLENITVIEGENRTLTCNASGSPVPTVTWTRVSTNNQSNGPLRYLTNISRNDAGEYKCEAINDCGNSSASTFLTVRFQPENFKFTVSESTVCQGAVVTFNCSADGNPPVDTYQLLENGTPVSDGSNRLGMWSRNMSIGGEFIYKCMANNSAGTAYSMSLTVTVNVTSSIQEILDQNVTEGNNLTLTCNVSGTPPLKVSWIEPDGQRSDGSVLKLLNISRNQNGTYRCEASNYCGNATETASIDVQYKPENVQLMNSAMNNKACKGEMISFDCSADANPAVTYQLFENETAILNTSATGMWYRTLENEGTFVYKCMASNMLGSMYSTNVILTVNVPSSIIHITQHQNATEGDNVTLMCNVSGVPPPAVSWMTPNGARFSKYKLEVTNINRSQAGEYKCEASNECGNATNMTRIDVFFKPENVQLNSSAMNNKACKGKVISFNCSADAFPAVTSYQLFENETAILSTSATGMWSKTLENEGVFVYKCVANNSLGSEYSMSVTVSVNVPSSIIHITQHQNATEGDNVTLMCNVSGVPPPAVSWMTPNGARFSKYKLEVTNINRSQAGEYKCEASNECGNATNMTRIDVFFKPENVQLNSSAMNNKACKGKVISFNCSADAFPAVTSYQLFENETAILSTSATGMWSKTLENEGVFVYKCVANNSLGSEYSMSVTVSVNVPSSIIHITQHQNATEGDDVTLMCNVSGVPPPTVSWMTPNGTRVSGYKLEVKNINRSQAGEYKCEASNECGSATDMTRIDVQYKPENVQFTSSATDNKACKGDMISFNCSADADPSVTSYQLFENDTAILGVNREGMWNIKVSAGGVFMYKCVANNSIGSGVSSYVMVTVNVPSSIEAIQDRNVTEGETVTLTCTAFGMPPPNVSWIKPNNESVAGNVLELVNISRNEAGEYRCEASNECGNAKEMTSIDVHYKPENVQFTSSATDNKACKGDMISFNCSADANPSVTSYQLFENDAAIVDVNHLGMWNRNVPTGGLFMYKCVANNSIGTGVSSYVMVTVNVPSTIETIQDQNVTEGETVTLTCTASGMPPPNVFWIKPSNERVASNVLELVNISRNEAGQYKCEASNECGNATALTSIDVHYKPENVRLRTSVMNNIAIVGDTITFNCSADAKPAVTSYQLYKNDTAMEAKFPGVWKETLNSQGVFVYKCMATNTLGSAYSEDVTFTVDGCKEQCTDGRSCRKFGVKYACICPEGKTGTNCEDEVAPKKNFVVGLKLTKEFKKVYEDLENPETKTLVEEIKNNTMIAFQGTGLASVKVLKLRPGSVLADLELTFNKSVDQGSVDALLTQAVNDGKLGNMAIEDVVVGGTFPASAEPPKEDCGTFFEGEDCKKAKPGLIVLCIVGGVAVLAIIVAIIAYGLHKKKSDVGSFSNGNYERADPDGTAGSVERRSPGNVYGSVNGGYQYDGTNGHSHEMVTFKGTAANPSQTPGITLNDSSMTKKSQPGEGLYADLGEFHQKAPAPPPTSPVKMPPEYERTEYAELSHFLRAPVTIDDEKENDEKEEESNVEKNSSPEKGEDPSSDMGDDPSPDMGEDASPDMGEDASPDMGDAGNGNSSGSVGFVVSI